jgi:hypothetical protein
VKGSTRAAFALVAALAALVGDWVVSELFLTRATLAMVAAVLLLNALMLAMGAGLTRWLCSASTTRLLLRASATFGFVGLLAFSLRSASHPSVALGSAARIALVASVAIAVFVLNRRLGEALNDRLMSAVALGSLAFLLVPVAAKHFAPAPREWIAPTPDGTPSHRRATMFLLLDEFAYTAATPLADDLRGAGLQVTYDALVPAGRDTQNVVPAMFSGFDFSNVRVCGMSALCSGLNMLDFSALRVRRGDVHVVGQHFPYCDIKGLKSCFQLPLPTSFRSMYRSFAEHFLKRVGLHAPAFLAPAVRAVDQQRGLLDAQTRFISNSVFWRDGGVMYAHLFMPHPPGLDGMSTLDNDYANNIQVTRALVDAYRARMQASFGKNFSIVISSDHPLRAYWCNAEWYGAKRCATRPEFKDSRVPLIVASPETLPRADISNNRDVFQVLNRQAAL